MLPRADLSTELAEAQAALSTAREVVAAYAREREVAKLQRKAREIERLAVRAAAGDTLAPNQLSKLRLREEVSRRLAGCSRGDSIHAGCQLSQRPTSAAAAATAAAAAAAAAVAGDAASDTAANVADPFDEWMLAEAVARSTLDEVVAASADGEVEADAKMRTAAVLIMEHDENDEHESPPADFRYSANYGEKQAAVAQRVHEQPAVPDAHGRASPAALSRWQSEASELVSMGFELGKVHEMLTLCDGDLEAAVQLLCS